MSWSLSGRPWGVLGSGYLFLLRGEFVIHKETLFLFGPGDFLTRSDDSCMVLLCDRFWGMLFANE